MCPAEQQHAEVQTNITLIGATRTSKRLTIRYELHEDDHAQYRPADEEVARIKVKCEAFNGDGIKTIYQMESEMLCAAQSRLAV